MILFALVLGAVAQGPEAGLRSFHDGDFAAAAESFRAAVASRPDSPELLYDLALAEWRAGRLTAAEEAAERYAAVPGGGRVDLHHGLLGNIRYDEAKAIAAAAEAPQHQAAPAVPPGAGAPAAAKDVDPIERLQAAIAKAKAARDEFVRAAAAPTAGAEVARNTERALRLLADLEKKLAELEKQRDEQKKQQDKNQKKDDQEKDDGKDNEKDDQKKDDDQKQDPKDESKQDKQDPQDQQKQDQQSQSDPDKGEERPEPKQEPSPDEQQDAKGQEQDEPKDGQKPPEPAPEPKAGEDGKKDEAAAAQPRNDAPGEQQQLSELSPEQRQRLLDQLQQLDERLHKLRAAARAGRKPVERDW